MTSTKEPLTTAHGVLDTWAFALCWIISVPLYVRCTAVLTQSTDLYRIRNVIALGLAVFIAGVWRYQNVAGWLTQTASVTGTLLLLLVIDKAGARRFMSASPLIVILTLIGVLLIYGAAIAITWVSLRLRR